MIGRSDERFTERVFEALSKGKGLDLGHKTSRQCFETFVTPSQSLLEPYCTSSCILSPVHLGGSTSTSTTRMGRYWLGLSSGSGSFGSNHPICRSVLHSILHAVNGGNMTSSSSDKPATHPFIRTTGMNPDDFIWNKYRVLPRRMVCFTPGKSWIFWDILLFSDVDTIFIVWKIVPSSSESIVAKW